MAESCVDELPLTATVTTGEDRNKVLARWERQGKIMTHTVLGGWDEDDRRTKIRKVDIWQSVPGRARHLVESVEYDGRMPYPDEITFTKIALAVMALT